MRRLLGLLLLAVMPLAACDSDDGSGPDASIEGSYTLRTINGQSVPYVLYQEQGFKVEILNSTLTINQAGTFTQVASARLTQGTSVTTDQQTVQGTFTRTGNNLTLSTTIDGEVQTLTGVWNGDNQLTFTETDAEFGTMVQVYRK